MNLIDHEVIFFDFDGVIIDSLPIREKGFRSILKEYPKDKVDQLVAYHNFNGGLSRFVKITYFFEHILQEEVDPQRVQVLADEFSVIMRRELANKKYFIQETVDFIDQYASKILYIVSGSEQNELRYLCKELGIAHYFKAIYGSPTPKIELVKRVLLGGDYDMARCALVGDSINDYDAAVNNHIMFYGYNNSALKDVVAAEYINTFATFVS